MSSPMNSPIATQIDDALEILANRAFEYGGGLSNHGPMAAEALCRIGRPADAIKWSERYARLLEPQVGPSARIAAGRYREALGDLSRSSDWISFFESELKDAAWPEVLDNWASRLARGMVGAAYHGFIRTGHAVRALAEVQTPRRLRELAEALAYWAAAYQELPDAQLADGGWMPSEAISKVEMLPESERPADGNITDRLAPILSSKPVSYAASLVDTSIAPERFIADLTRVFSRVYLSNRDNFISSITFIHTITAPAAALLIIPHVRAITARRLLRYSWQGNAALYAAIAKSAQLTALDNSTPIQRDELIDRAVRSGDEHAIKFSEACLRMYGLQADPAYLIAADDAVTRLGSPIWQSWIENRAQESR